MSNLLVTPRQQVLRQHPTAKCRKVFGRFGMNVTEHYFVMVDQTALHSCAATGMQHAWRLAAQNLGKAIA